MKAFITTLLCLFSLQSFAGFNEALTAYSNKDYAKAYTAFQSMAELGEKRSQFNLGVMYYYGQHVEKDINKAYAWIKLSTEGEMLGEQEKSVLNTVVKNLKDKASAEKSYAEISAKYSSSILLDKLFPRLIKPENSAAFSATPLKFVQPNYPRKAALKGVQGSVRFEFDLDKTGTPRNITVNESIPEGVFVKDSVRAVKKWKFKLPESGSKEVLTQKRLRYTMEFLLSNAAPLSIQSEQYQKTLKDAKAGDANAQFTIGYWQSKVKTPDNENPTAWYLKAAQQGHSFAQFELANSLMKGQGCIQDKTKGMEWLIRSASNNNRKAVQLLGIKAAEEETLESHLKAVNYFKQANELDGYAKLMYAKLLASSPFSEVRNAKLALSLTEEINDSNFYDEITPYEINAEAYLALGDKDEALDMLEEALDEAESLDADTSMIEQRIKAISK